MFSSWEYEKHQKCKQYVLLELPFCPKLLLPISAACVIVNMRFSAAAAATWIVCVIYFYHPPHKCVRNDRIEFKMHDTNRFSRFVATIGMGNSTLEIYSQLLQLFHFGWKQAFGFNIFLTGKMYARSTHCRMDICKHRIFFALIIIYYY